MKRHNYTLVVGALAGITLLVSPAVGQTIWYVDVDAAGGDGTSWATAFNDLQEGLDAADENENPADQIWVAAGTYYPGTNFGDTFLLTAGVELYGGLVGNELPATFDPPEVDNRNFVANETILSGDIGVKGGYSDNITIVVTGAAEDLSGVLDGFTITGAQRTGVYLPESSPTIQNCVFRENQSSVGGAGIDMGWESDPEIYDCIFVGNRGEYAGAIFIANYCKPVIERCTFERNFSCQTGGAITIKTNCQPELWNCRFIENVAGTDGGGICTDANSGTTQLVNCLFSENVAIGNGGAIHNSGTPLTAINCTLSGNWAAETVGGLSRESGTTIVRNTILWGNRDDDTAATVENRQISAGCDVVEYSLVEGLAGYASGTGNIDGDPMFEDAELQLTTFSPCVDSGATCPYVQSVDPTHTTT